MVLAGGPNREHAVSLMSGAQVSAALANAGHDVLQRDITPDDLGALDEFVRWGGHVIFPALHGSWGEGGALQFILEEQGIPYVGSNAPVSEVCMDKHRTKLVLQRCGLATPCFELLSTAQRRSLQLPLVIKAPREGSSIDMEICHDESAIRRARRRLRQRHPKLLLERFIPGKELTVGLLGDHPRTIALPPIQIVPAIGYYDYDAKYLRDDTGYCFDPGEMGLPEAVLNQARELAVKSHDVLGCRHLSRVDLIVDQDLKLWIIEINTLPGFTSHSLIPMAAARAGISFAALTNRLVEMALEPSS